MIRATVEGGGSRAMTRNTDLFVFHHKGLQPPVALLPSTSAPIGSTLVGKVSSNFHQHWCHGPMVGNTWGEGHLGNADPLESCTVSINLTGLNLENNLCVSSCCQGRLMMSYAYRNR